MYDPDDYERVIQPLRQGRTYAVSGSRFAVREQRRILLFWHAPLRRSDLSDHVEHGERPQPDRDRDLLQGPSRRSVEENPADQRRFGFESEMTAPLAQWGARIYEVLLSYQNRSYAERRNISSGTG